MTTFERDEIRIPTYCTSCDFLETGRNGGKYCPTNIIFGTAERIEQAGQGSGTDSMEDAEKLVNQMPKLIKGAFECASALRSGEAVVPLIVTTDRNLTEFTVRSSLHHAS